MIIIDKLRCFKSFEAIYNDEEILNDSAKYLLTCSRVMTSFINSWPEDSDFNIYHALVLVMCFVNITSMIVSIIVTTEDTDALVLKLFAIGALAGVRISLFFCLCYVKSISILDIGQICSLTL